MADTLKTLTCPACGKTMEKVFLPSQGINIDICLNGCGGIYFDNRELDKFDERNEDISVILEKISNKKYEPVDSSPTRVCPNCGANMVKNHTSIKQEIEIDECYSCGGKFLDNDELQKIRAEYLNNEQRDADIQKYVYSVIGHELDELDRNYAKTKISRKSIGRQVFEKLLGL